MISLTFDLDVHSKISFLLFV